MNISFESDFFNIYDPYYTSEEELDSFNNDKEQDNNSQSDSLQMAAKKTQRREILK